MMMATATNTTIKTCSKCGTNRTYMQNNCEKWYYIKDDDDNNTKERICKNCYNKSRIKKNKQQPKIIDLTKLKPSEIKINNNSLSSIATADTDAIIDNITNLKPKKNKTTYKGGLTKKDKNIVIKQRNAIPFIENISFSSLGSEFCQCGVCGSKYSLLELTIPNYRDLLVRTLDSTKRNLIVRICNIC